MSNRSRRKKTKQRNQLSIKNATQFISSSDPEIISLLGGTPASSGYSVTEASAMRVSAVAACVQLLGGTIATLPLPIYKQTDKGREKIKPPLWRLLNLQPCPAWTAASMIEWWIRSIAFRGDAFSIIGRDNQGQSNKIIPLHPDKVKVTIDDEGEITYAYKRKDGTAKGVHADDMLHIPGFGYDGTKGRGLSIIKHAAFQSIGVALAADDFSGQFFVNSGMQKHVIKVPGKMDDDAIERLKTEYKNKYAGSENVGKPMVLTQGLDIKEISLSSADVELLDSRKYQVVDIARAFGVPPFMIGSTENTTTWGTGIEQMTLGFVKFTLQAYLNRIEQEINRKLFRQDEAFVEFNLGGLLRGDSDAESKSLRQARGGSQGPGWETLNEIRAKKNLPPLSKEDGGNKVYEPKVKEANARPEKVIATA